MNAMYLSELADKTRRGLRGRIENGKAGGGLCYGYRVLRRLENGVVTTGEREIVDEEATVIRRIFRDYAAGASPKQITKALNKEGIPGPQGALWSPSTIHGNAKRGLGILHNELYIGRMVWNRQRFLKDPDTGKRVARPNPQSVWITKDVPELCIVDDDVWKAVRDRYASVQRKWAKADESRRFNQFRRPKYLFSGLTKCGECGAGFIVHSRELLGCFGARDRGTCTNMLRISRLDIESRVLHALQTKLLRKEFFEEFCREFAKEMNRLRMEQRSGLNAAKRELSKIEVRRRKLLDLMLDDVVPTSEGKDEMLGLTARRDELQQPIKTAHEPPPLLHPSMADLYKTKVEQRAGALQREDSRLEASETRRGLIDSIVLTPEEGQPPSRAGEDSRFGGPRLRIELRGNLAAMLTVAQQTKRSPETGDLSMPIQLVAGVGFEPAMTKARRRAVGECQCTCLALAVTGGRRIDQGAGQIASDTLCGCLRPRRSSPQRRIRCLAFAGAVSPEQIRQRVVAFVAGVFVNRSGRPRHRQFAFPGLHEGGGVVDLEPVEQGIGVEKTEPLYQVKISVPPEVAARIPVEAAAVVEVRRAHDQRLAFPVTDRIAQPQPYLGWKMGATVQANDSRVVNHLRIHNECVLGLHDLVVAVVGIRKHGGPGGEERQTLILKTRILGTGGMRHRFDTAALNGGSLGREGGNAAIGRVGHDRGAEGLDRT